MSNPELSTIRMLEEQLEKAWNQIDFQQEAYRELLEERDALLAERDKILNVQHKQAGRELRLTSERDALKAVNERLRELIERMGVHSDNKETCALCAKLAAIDAERGE